MFEKKVVYLPLNILVNEKDLFYSHNRLAILGTVCLWATAKNQSKPANQRPHGGKKGIWTAGEDLPNPDI